MEKRDVLNRLRYILIYSLSAIFLELIVFMTLDFGYLPKYLLFDIGLIFVIDGILFLIKGRKKKIALIITLLSLQALLNCVNVCYYWALGDIFSFELLLLGAETAKAFSLKFLDFKSIFLNIFAMTFIILCLLYFTKHEKKQENVPYKRFSALAILLSMFMFISVSGVGIKFVAENALAEVSLTDTYYVAKSDVYLYDKFHFKQQAFKKFGTFGFYSKGILDLVFNGSIDKKEKKELIEYANSNIVAENPNALLKDNNLIVFMLESFEWWAIDPILTPTLYSFLNGEATAFTNFRGRNKTNVSEAISVLGNTVKTADFQLLSRSKNFKPSNALPYKFRDLGYTANFFHPYDGTFYKRNRVNKSYGYESVNALQSVKWSIPSFGDFYLEEDFIKEVIDKMVPTDKQFFSFYLTVGTHGPYESFNKRYADYFELYEQNLPQIKTYMESEGYHFPTNKKYYNILKEYKCAAMDTDRMLAYLLQDLENKNLLDTTTVLLYSDHNCYYDNLDLIIRYGTIDVSPNNSHNYNIPFMIYDKKLPKQQIDTFCNTYDIYPTICELFGLEYSKNLTQGYNVFSDEIENSLFASNLMAIFTDRIYSYSINDIYDTSKLGDVTEEEIIKFQLNAIKFYEKQDKIDKIYINKLNKYVR